MPSAMNATLREARSTPYIGPATAATAPTDGGGRHSHHHHHYHHHVMNPALARQLVNGAISEENFMTRVNEELGAVAATATSARPSASLATATTTGGGGVLFNTGGSSSSSTDLSALMQFYNDSADADITAQWMDLYRAQKQQKKRNSTHSEILRESNANGDDDDVDQSTPADSRKISLSATTSAVSTAERRATTTGASSDDIGGSGHVGGGLVAGRCGANKDKPTSRSKNYSESAENLFSANSQSSLSYMSSTSTIEAGGCSPGAGSGGGAGGGSGGGDDKKYSINRSMDVLPRSRDQFRMLEKCCSVDLPTQKQMPSARLARSKEMPNIADVDDYD